SNNQWIQFENAEILSDSTNGLLTTGIIKFSIPRTITDNNTILASGYHWIMAAVQEKTNAICDLIAVFPQAGLASFSDNGNDPNFLATPLAANSISKLKIKEAEIKSISQPYASFGGKVEETDFEYYRRVSERLRHKTRGISIWDYERIVLQEFPEVYKVKCINHSTYNFEVADGSLLDSEFAPGYVTLIAVPELKNQNAIDPLEPRISLNTLDKIKTFLTKKISPFAATKLKVINPLFEKIQVEFYVEFRSGFDRGFYEKQVVQDIIEFLSPWAFAEGKDIVFGGKMHRSVILNFLEERPYVDFVTDFKMNHILSDSNIKYDVEEAIATTARSVLVSFDSHIVYETSSCS
ncbi:MAG TPA: baseplate J/gp47 family protein, partial [Bacteroidales bacterium]